MEGSPDPLARDKKIRAAQKQQDKSRRKRLGMSVHDFQPGDVEDAQVLHSDVDQFMEDLADEGLTAVHANKEKQGYTFQIMRWDDAPKNEHGEPIMKHTREPDADPFAKSLRPTPAKKDDTPVKKDEPKKEPKSKKPKRTKGGNTFTQDGKNDARIESPSGVHIRAFRNEPGDHWTMVMYRDDDVLGGVPGKPSTDAGLRRSADKALASHNNS
jgi:hypothetical protein